MWVLYSAGALISHAEGWLLISSLAFKAAGASNSIHQFLPSISGQIIVTNTLWYLMLDHGHFKVRIFNDRFLMAYEPAVTIDVCRSSVKSWVYLLPEI